MGRFEYLDKKLKEEGLDYAELQEHRILKWGR